MLVHSRVYIDAIVIGERKRPVDDDKVAVLAKSMETIGLQQPISIWAEKDEIEGAPDTLHLVAGLHRLRAAESLGWEQIDAVYVDLSDIDRRRWEIAENLHRSELTALQRDQHVAEWIRLTEEAEQVQSRHSDANEKSKRADGRGHRKESGTRKAAREIGVSEPDARRAVKVASLTDEAKEAAKEVGLDNNRSALLKAAAKPPEQQSQALREIAAAKLRAQQHEPEPPCSEEEEEPEETEADRLAWATLVNAWDDAPERVQRDLILENYSFARRVLGENGYL